MALDITNIKAQLQAKIDALDVNSTEADVLLVSKTVNQLVGSGIDLSNLQTALQSKLDVVTNATVLKDLLLISKTIEAAGVEITQEDIIATGTNQVTAVETAGAAEIANVQAESATQVGVVQTEGATQVAAVQSAASGFATQADIDTSISALVDTAPDTLNTLNELAAALGDDPNFATTVTASLGDRVVKSAPVLGGNLDGAGYTYTNLQPAQTASSVTSSHVINMDEPLHIITMTGATNFTFSNVGEGKVTMIKLYAPSSTPPAFSSDTKWPTETEPTWADYDYWLISVIGHSSTVTLASAQGYTV
jgi:hypothetical protein